VDSGAIQRYTEMDDLRPAAILLGSVMRSGLPAWKKKPENNLRHENHYQPPCFDDFP
jgi:hypothetical protein